MCKVGSIMGHRRRKFNRLTKARPINRTQLVWKFVKFNVMTMYVESITTHESLYDGHLVLSCIPWAISKFGIIPLKF